MEVTAAEGRPDAVERVDASTSPAAAHENKKPTTKPGQDLMPVSDIMGLLQAMREEQLQTLKTIADGVQQLQSQVLLLNEMATESERKASLCLDRLAGVERRVGSIPVPILPPARPGRGGPGTTPTPTSTRAPAASTIEQRQPVAPEPVIAPTAPAAAPSWLDRRAEHQGQTRTHFMKSPAPARMAAVPPTPSSAPSAMTTGATAENIARGVASIPADRRACEGRLSEVGSSTNGSNAQQQQQRSTASMSPGAPPVVGAGPSTALSGSSRGSFVGGAGGVFASNPSFLPGGVPVGVGGSVEDEASRVARERAAREETERRERERREFLEREALRKKAEEERLQREREEARRRKQEEEARKAREAEEAKAREEARRRAAARRQAKTRDIMSSLFDKEQPDDGSSLFGGLGAALPAGSSVFSESGGSRLDARGSGTKDAPPPHVALPSSMPLQSSSSSSNSKGSLFAGLADVGPSNSSAEVSDRPGGVGQDAPRGGMASMFESAVDSTASGGGRGSLFDRDPPALPQVASSSARSGLGVGIGIGIGTGIDTGAVKSAGKLSKECDSFDGFVGQKKGVFGDRRPSAATAIAAAASLGPGTGLFGGSDDLGSPDDFLSSGSTFSSRPPAPTPARTPTPPVASTSASASARVPEGNLASIAIEAVPEQVQARAEPENSALGSAGRGQVKSAEATAVAGTGAELFAGGNFSIDSGDEDGGNAFAADSGRNSQTHGGGGVGGRGSSGSVAQGNASAAFLSELGDADLSLDDATFEAQETVVEVVGTVVHHS